MQKALRWMLSSEDFWWVAGCYWCRHFWDYMCHLCYRTYRQSRVTGPPLSGLTMQQRSSKWWAIFLCLSRSAWWLVPVYFIMLAMRWDIKKEEVGSAGGCAFTPPRWPRLVIYCTVIYGSSRTESNMTCAWLYGVPCTSTDGRNRKDVMLVVFAKLCTTSSIVPIIVAC